METETKEIIPGNHLVCFADGSCLRNPGNGGYGVFGYIYRYANKSKNIKHPSSGHYLTTEGIHKERNESLIEVTHVLEVITALCNPRATNNEA